MYFIFRHDALLLTQHTHKLPDSTACVDIGITTNRCLAVWSDAHAPQRTAFVEPTIEAPPGYTFQKLRTLYGVLDECVMAQAGRAYQIAEWARTHRYCGVCSTATERVIGEFCLRCPACGQRAYPRLSPAMMVLIRHGERILLARHAGRIAATYTALAGFVEPGETIEQTVHREVYEEVGLKVANLRYFGSQPWPFPDSLMVAFTADYVAGQIRIQEEEIVEARWFGPEDAIPAIPGKYSIAGTLIRAHSPQSWHAALG